MPEGPISLAQALWFNPKQVLPHTNPISLRSAITIGSLAVRIVTTDVYLAGTDNDVYFDIGPLSWRLDPDSPHNSSSDSPFSRGSDDTFFLDLHGLQLSTADIVWLRIQKKGIFGVTGTGDGVDGGWRPQSIHLIVNNSEYISFYVNQWISDPDNTFWRQVIHRPYSFSGEELFAHSLRVLPNDALGAFSEDVGILTTYLFKYHDISGWLGTNLPLTCATGRVIREPAKSTDGLATIDIQVESVQVGATAFLFDGAHGIHHPRYLRVEYLSFDLPDHPVPHNGQRVAICGVVKWDTDHEGWYEIHPRDASDVTLLAA